MADRVNIYLPIAFTPNNRVEKFLEYLTGHPDQKRKLMVWDDCLAKAASIRAEQVAITFSHCFQGDCANRIVRRGCTLPLQYAENGNSIESLVAGTGDPQISFNALLRSSGHTDHLLGRNSFFVEQTRVGIAYLEKIGSPYRFYFVILISK